MGDGNPYWEVFLKESHLISMHNIATIIFVQSVKALSSKADLFRTRPFLLSSFFASSRGELHGN